MNELKKGEKKKSLGNVGGRKRIKYQNRNPEEEEER